MRKLIITLAVSSLLAHPCVAGEQQAPAFRPSSLASLFDLKLGETANPPDALPPEALSPPLPPTVPLPGLDPKLGLEWYARDSNVISGPYLAADIAKRCQSLGALFWRVGMSDWAACSEMSWSADSTAAPAPRAKVFVTAFGPPPISGDPPDAVWFWKDDGLGPWSGPFPAAEIVNRIRTLGWTDNPQSWRPGLGQWVMANPRTSEQDQTSQIDALRNLEPLAQERPVGSGLEPDAAAAMQARKRLAGTWAAIGPNRDGYSADAVQLAIDPRGLISIRPTVANADGEVMGGSDWVAGAFVVQPIEDDALLLSASFDGYRLKYGYPIIMKLRWLGEGVLKDEWSGLILKRQDVFPE